MHIAVDGSRLAVGERTGTESYTWELLQALGQLDREHSYTLYVQARPPQLPPLGVNWQLQSLVAPRLWTHTRLGPHLLLHQPDVVFIPAHVLPLTPPRRSVVTIHDLGYEYYPEAHPFAHRMYLRLSTWWSARMATHVLAISQATRRDVLRFTRISADKISVVYHGVHPRFRPFEPVESQAVAARYGLNGTYFLFISTIQPRKNLVRLIEAYAQARTSIPDLPPLALGGRTGWLTQQIEARAQQLNVSEYVRFLGYVDHHDLPALISGASIYLLPSLYEGFGMTVLEAMAAGTPVITSNVASLPEVAGDAALLVDPLDTQAIADALIALWLNDDLRANLRQRGLSWAAQWTWERCARQTHALLTAVGSGKQGKDVACDLKI